MTKVENKRCELTERDIKLFRFLEQFGVVSMGQVWARYFKGIGRKEIPYMYLDKTLMAKGEGSRVYKRMSKLASYGFLERTQWFIPRQTLFRLTTRGHWQLTKRGINKFSAPVDGWPQENEMWHSLLVGALASTFEYVLNWKVISERELESEYWIEARKKNYRPDKPTFPDLLVGAAPGAPAMRIELELTLKSDKRYKELWGSMGSAMCGQEPCVLYIAGSPAIQKHLLALASEDYCPGLFCGTLEGLKENEGFCNLRNSGGKIIRLKRCRFKEDPLYGTVNNN